MIKLGQYDLGKIILGPVDIDIGFKLLCKKYGAGAVFSAPIVKAKDINITIPMIAEVQSTNVELSKIIKALEKNKNVIGVHVPAKQAKTIKTKLPLIITSDVEVPCDVRVVSEAKKSKTPIVLHKEFKDAEEAYDIFRNKQAECVMITETALQNPVFFEQLIGYIEKGYYNKTTRKRREKLVYEYQEICKKHKLIVHSETIQMILKEE